MNPLDWRGPEFLLFYTVLALLTVTAVLVRRWRREPAGLARGPLTDPYRIAFLRGGVPETLRVAALALLDRGLLRAAGDELVAEPEAEKSVEHPLERALLVRFASSRTARELHDSPILTALAEEHRAPLQSLGLLPDAAAQRAWRNDATVACAALVVVALSKVFVALARGRTNVVLLIVLAIAAVFVVTRLTRPRLTQRGRRVMLDLQVLFATLRQRTAALAAGMRAPDARMVAAVYGVGALAAMPAFGHAAQLFPRASVGRSFGWASGSGASCSATCGSSCGSSCGGGGCGGGSSGCGGCGS